MFVLLLSIENRWSDAYSLHPLVKIHCVCARIPEGLEDRGIAIAGDSAQVISALVSR